MASPYSSNSRSPPPLQHPVPTHPAFIPEPPSTPNSPGGYMRFSGSPSNQAVPPANYYGHGQHAQPTRPNQPQPHGTAYASSQFQAYPQGHGPPPPPHQQPLPQGIDFTQWGVNPATAQLGMQLGQSAVAAGQEYVQKNFGSHIPVSLLKHHFNVSNSYVIRKLQLVLFPWRHKRWTRANRPTEQGQAQWLPPRDDINSPDLYIPVMAFVTYILLAALYSGIQAKFHPEILGRVATRALVVVLVEFGFIKLGCYLLNISGSSQVTDLFAYSGYKFVGVVTTVLFAFPSASKTVYLAAFIYSFSANGFFLLRALKYVVLPDPRDTSQHVGTLSPGQRSRRIWFLFAIALSQFLYMGILVRI
ncbi:protein transporter yif1 [Fomitiporia mediterranea MF3/22]|uniref:protein transporter yif1 n=1 Tax=Fomitiporia mediterranea (strain MF3/22) TaxID=694068 RepID=UPI0004409B3A|nr:protein transporter yif1 [Fomitiporia mediterranea MF3/22]EJD02954.1 protein transporter yif1 [Fomitiporia mediterranea MF3/22]